MTVSENVCRATKRCGAAPRVVQWRLAGRLLVTLMVAGLLLSAMPPVSAVETEPRTGDGSLGGLRVTVGSKNFTESYILAEIIAQLLESEGARVARRFGLGGTLIAWQALSNGGIDVYVEYSGTVAQAILSLDDSPPFEALNERLADEGLQLLAPLGFNNTYGLAMRRDIAQEQGITRISDLVGAHSELNIVVSHEFLNRQDGWPGLRRVYGFDTTPGGIEHGLAYQALERGTIDVTDVYSTDGELVRYDLVVLDDDAGFFPEYLAAPLVRRDMPPGFNAVLSRLGGTLDDAAMQQLNAAVVFDGSSFAEAASGFLGGLGIERADPGAQLWRDLRRNTVRHLQLTGIALIGAVLTGVLLGILIYRTGWLSRIVVYGAGLLQTIPSIALLALMIPLFGIGMLPAVVALFLYSLLPILRNTVTSLTTVDPVLVRVATAMGLTPLEQMRHVYLPLALPGIFAGVRTAAVISIGTATLAAFIGAGGLGDPIVTGLALNDSSLILQGAIPAALLAVATELLFEGAERAAIPRHLSGGAVNTPTP